MNLARYLLAEQALPAAELYVLIFRRVVRAVEELDKPHVKVSVEESLDQIDLKGLLVEIGADIATNPKLVKMICRNLALNIALDQCTESQVPFDETLAIAMATVKSDFESGKMAGDFISLIDDLEQMGRGVKDQIADLIGREADMPEISDAVSNILSRLRAYCEQPA